MNRTLLSLAGVLLIAPWASLTHAQTATMPIAPNTLQGTGHAHGHHRRHQGGMERMDADHDGRVSRVEFDAGLASRASHRSPSGEHRAPDFVSIDRNQDGYIVASEVRAYRERMRPRREAERRARFDAHFAQADLNHDGKLGRVEVSEKSPRLERHFAWLDEDRDGLLSRAELQAARRDRH